VLIHIDLIQLEKRNVSEKIKIGLLGRYPFVVSLIYLSIKIRTYLMARKSFDYFITSKTNYFND